MGKLDADKTQKNENQEQAKERLVNSLVGGAIVIGAVVVLVYLFRFGGYSISKDPANWGALGDYLGGVLNPIFAFFAFVILVVSLKVQSKELKATTDEMRNANDAQERLLQQQNQANQLQNFENLFFQLLELKESAYKNIQMNNLIFQGKSINEWILNTHITSNVRREVVERSNDIKAMQRNLDEFISFYKKIWTDKEIENEIYLKSKENKWKWQSDLSHQLKYVANKIGFCTTEEFNIRFSQLLSEKKVYVLLKEAQKYVEKTQESISIKEGELISLKLKKMPFKYTDYENIQTKLEIVSDLNKLNESVLLNL